MICEGAFKNMFLRQIKKAFNRHPQAFQKYHIMGSEIVSNIASTLHC